MRHKAHYVKITEQNAKQVYGRLMKFFRGDRVFKSWYQWNCGNKKRISHLFELFSGTMIDTRELYKFVYCNLLESRYMGKLHDETWLSLVIHLSERCEMRLYPGDEVAFLGNRVILKQHDQYLEQYSYVVFQIHKWGKWYE